MWLTPEVKVNMSGRSVTSRFSDSRGNDEITTSTGAVRTETGGEKKM